MTFATGLLRCRKAECVGCDQGENTGRQRYTVDHEKIGEWLIEDVVESVGLETNEAARVTITDEQTGRSANGAGSDYDEALEVACRKLGISPGDLDDETVRVRASDENNHDHHANRRFSR